MNLNKTYPKILIHCQYVYGIGHFVRTLELAQELISQFEVHVLIGGKAIPNFELPSSINYIQLPSIYKNENENHLTPYDNSHSIDQCFKLRQEIINQSIEKIRPDILITEHFPFGLLFESEALNLISKVKTTNPHVKIVCSVRDIIESSKGGKRDAYICDLINNQFDLVLVHGDGKFTALSESFPLIHKINIPIIQTGYIVSVIPQKLKNECSPIIIASVGGGQLGNELLDAVIESHTKIKEKINHKLIMFAGAFQEDFEKLNDKIYSINSKDITIYKFDRLKYLEILSNATLVISLGGYNSIIESVAASKLMLIYQRKSVGGNEEQSLRIKQFEKSGHIKVISPEELEKESLSRIIIDKMSNYKKPFYQLNLDGAQNSKHSLISLLKL